MDNKPRFIQKSEEYIMKKLQRAQFEKNLREKSARIEARSKEKMRQKLKNRRSEKEKTFAKFYEMSYNELRKLARKRKIKIWRKTKEELIESLIEQERLH